MRSVSEVLFSECQTQRNRSSKINKKNRTIITNDIVCFNRKYQTRSKLLETMLNSP